jgi:hypothetical protein
VATPGFKTSLTPSTMEAARLDNERHGLADPEKSLILWF